jgi:hypothetical protein
MKRISKAIIVCSLTVGLPALAAEPATADQHLARAEALKQSGGWAYKTGAIDRELAEARRLNAAAVVVVLPSAAAQEHLARAEALKQSGGWAYKTGAVDRQLALATKAESEVPAAVAGCPMHLANAATHRDHARALAASGGWAYKTGAINRELGIASRQATAASTCLYATGWTRHICNGYCVPN